MTHYVALLRGINVGGHVVKMDRLRALFAEAGLSGAQTFIASGNVLFSSATRSVPAARAQDRAAPPRGTRVRGGDVSPER